jgi:hypothetical protein
MFSYTVYDLCIRSVLPLPELVPKEGTADVTVSLGDTGFFSPLGLPRELHYYWSSEAVYLCREDIGTVLVRGGCEIVVNPVPEANEQALRLLILGPALAVLLHQRELLVLHASAVSMAGGVVAFMGGSGWGKSTTAAALYARGYSIVADDVMAVQIETDTGLCTVAPGFPQLKLWPKAAASSLGDMPETLPRLDPRLDKRARRVAREFTSAPLPLKRIYVLDEGEHHEVEYLRPQDALLKIIAHSYCSGLLPSTGASAHFLQCTSIVNNVTVCGLRRRRSLSALSELTQLIEEDLSRSTGQTEGALC